MSEPSTNPRPAPYWNPYLAGLLLGVALLASYVILGAGLGASAALARFAAWIEYLIDPEAVQGSEYFGRWFPNPLAYYLVFMFVGAFFGGLISAMSARRIRIGVERGRAFPAGARLLLALIGGVLVGFASRLSLGCTSGQAMTGSALMINGSLVFLGCCFGGGYLMAWFVRRQWND